MVSSLNTAEGTGPRDVSPFGRLVRRAADWWNRYRFRRSAKRLRSLTEQGRRAGSHELMCILAGMSEADCERFPATTCLLRLQVLHALAREGNQSEFLKRLSDLADLKLAAPWDARSKAECVGRVIAACLLNGSPQAVNEAKKRFVAFRIESSEPVPEAFPLTVRIARQGHADGHAARMYHEYLVCSGADTDSGDYRAVKAALAQLRKKKRH